ncbi:unnamed protein product [Moneuplotes crassus]|uniref:FYVE-type domain-containing protein n=1 Tax=Euplotes crassus TaxID=5936 RepID=A0AAD1U9B5_EUPCR|nr:unnamed protein product [Moneuplotes crassus]
MEKDHNSRKSRRNKSELTSTRKPRDYRSTSPMAVPQEEKRTFVNLKESNPSFKIPDGMQREYKTTKPKRSRRTEGIRIPKIKEFDIQKMYLSELDICVRQNKSTFCLNDPLFPGSKNFIKKNRESCQGCDEENTKKKKLGHCKLCGETYCKSCLYFRQTVESQIMGDGKTTKRVRICNICRGKITVKKTLLQAISDYRKEGEDLIQPQEELAEIDKELKNLTFKCEILDQFDLENEHRRRINHYKIQEQELLAEIEYQMCVRDDLTMKMRYCMKERKQMENDIKSKDLDVNFPKITFMPKSSSIRKHSVDKSISLHETSKEENAIEGSITNSRPVSRSISGSLVQKMNLDINNTCPEESKYNPNEFVEEKSHLEDWIVVTPPEGEQKETYKKPLKKSSSFGSLEESTKKKPSIHKRGKSHIKMDKNDECCIIF